MNLSPEPMRSSLPYAYTLVAVQFACLGYLGLTGPVWVPGWGYRVVLLAGVGLGLWAVGVMRLGRFNIAPHIKPGAQLVSRGPYAIIRHPMYTALLIVTLVWVVVTPTWNRLLVWGVLLVNLLVKLHYEERLLTAQFPGYAAYQTQTRRLIPWFY